jgi:hypothetical protein
MSKSRSKGCFFGTPICIKGDGGHGLSAYRIPLGPIGVAQQRDDPRAAKRRGLHPARAAGCDIYATLYPQCNGLPVPGPRPAKRARRMESRAAAHNLCASMRTTYTRTTQARLRQYVALTYRVPLISIRGSLMNIYLTIDLTIIMG